MRTNVLGRFCSVFISHMYCGLTQQLESMDGGESIYSSFCCGVRMVLIRCVMEVARIMAPVLTADAGYISNWNTSVHMPEFNMVPTRKFKINTCWHYIAENSVSIFFSFSSCLLKITGTFSWCIILRDEMMVLQVDHVQVVFVFVLPPLILQKLNDFLWQTPKSKNNFSFTIKKKKSNDFSM